MLKMLSLPFTEARAATPSWELAAWVVGCTPRPLLACAVRLKRDFVPTALPMIKNRTHNAL